MNIVKTAKGTELPLRDLKGKQYLEVTYRVLWMREDHPDWGIETAFLTLDAKIAIAHATIRDSMGRILAQGTKTETPGGFADYVEKAETGAVGRALALCGYGTQFAQELEEGDRIVDGPRDPKAPAKPQSPPAASIPMAAPSIVEALRQATKEELGLTEDVLKEVLKSFKISGWDSIPVKDLPAIKEALKRRAAK